MSDRANFPLIRTAVALALAIIISLAVYRQATIDRGTEYYKPAEVANIGRGSAAFLMMTAERRFADNDPQGAISLAQRSLTLAPANPGALRVFALASDALGKHILAAQAMSLAGLWGWRDPVVQLWLMNEAGKYGDLTNMLIHADALLRTEGPTNRVLALVAATLNARGGVDLVAARMADNPAWRLYFFDYIARSGRALAPMMVPLAKAMRSTSPVTSEEIAPVVNALFDSGSEQEADAIWRKVFAQKYYTSSNAVFDSDFEHFAAKTPNFIARFDWELVKTPGLDIGVRPAPSKGGKALFVRYSGEEGAPLLRQSLILAPGDHQLRAAILRDSAAVPLTWKITCSNTRRLYLTGRPASESGRWTTESYSFSVPPGCGSQKLELVAAAGGDISGGTTWIDDVSVNP